MSIHAKPTNPETGEQLDHYEANGALFCHDEGEFFDWQTGDVTCPHCDGDFEVTDPDVIYPMSDGLELELADGRRVRPVLETKDGERLLANRISPEDETAVYGRDADDYYAKLFFQEVECDD